MVIKHELFPICSYFLVDASFVFFPKMIKRKEKKRRKKRACSHEAIYHYIHYYTCTNNNLLHMLGFDYKRYARSANPAAWSCRLQTPPLHHSPLPTHSRQQTVDSHLAPLFHPSPPTLLRTAWRNYSTSNIGASPSLAHCRQCCCEIQRRLKYQMLSKLFKIGPN